MSFWGFPIIPLIFWLILFLFLWKIPLALDQVRDNKTKNSLNPIENFSISVIIPARNEEKNLKSLLDSLVMQSIKPLEIIVVNDNSRDNTAKVALEKGAKLINLLELPYGWTGKSYACFEGAKYSSGDILVFLDADTILEVDGLRRLLQLYEKTGGFLSVQPFHLMKKPYEKLSAFFNLISFLNMNISSIIPWLNKTIGAFGPCFICRRSEYFEIGGHEAVKGEIIEDMALANLASKKGYKVNAFAGRGVISFRMYPEGISQLVEGWTKNFATGAVKTGFLLFLISFGWITGALSGPIDIFKGLVIGNICLLKNGIILYILFSAQIYFFLRKLGNFGVISSTLYPFNLAFFIFIFLRSLVYTYLLGYVCWKGRKIPLRKRS